MDGGLQLLEERLDDNIGTNSAEFVGAFMNIIESITPYLLNRAVRQIAQPILDKIENYMLNSPLDILKAFSSDMIKSVYSGFKVLAKRLYPQEEAEALYERFYLNIAVTCVKTDYLERKLNGVTFLGDIYKSIKSKELGCVDKKQLIKVIEDGSLGLH